MSTFCNQPDLAQTQAQQEVPEMKDPVQKQAPTDAELADPTSHVEVLKSPSARGSKRPAPTTPMTTPTKPNNKDTSKPTASTAASAQDQDDDDETPRVLNFSDMTKLEKEKVRRVVSPKKATGNLEVPENIFEMWKDAGKGRDRLFRMWCKSGGVKAGGGPNNLGSHFLFLSELNCCVCVL